MNLAKVWIMVRGILPTKRIGAWIVGILAAVVALVMGLSSADLKEHFCSTKEVVELPKIELKPAEAPIVAPAPAEKK